MLWPSLGRYPWLAGPRFVRGSPPKNRPDKSGRYACLLASSGVVGHADVIRSVGAFEDVAVEHRVRVAGRDLLPLGSALEASLGTKLSRRESFGGGGSRTPVRKASQLEDYMLIPFA